MTESKVWYMPLLFLCLISFGSMADNTVLANALTPIAKDLHATVAQMQFANIVFSLMAGSLMIGAGLLGGRIGWKRMLMTGAIIFTIAEFIAYIAPNIEILIYVARVLAGVGASLSIPAVIGLIPLLYKGKRMALGFGLLGVVTALGSSIAPIISGVLIVTMGWRFCFLLLSILFIICLVGIIIFIKEPERQPVKSSFDVIGFVLLFCGLTTVIYAISQITQWGLITDVHAPFTIMGMSPILFLIFIGLIILFLFWQYELKREHKYGAEAVLIPEIFFRNTKIFGGILMSSYVFYILGGIMFSVVLYMQVVLDQNAIMTGLYLCIFSAGMSLTSILTPSLAKRYSPRFLCQVGIMISSISSIILAIGIGLSTINLAFYIGLFLIGFGVGIVASQASFAVSKGITDNNLVSHSGGIQGAARNIGQCIGVALVGLVLMFSLTATIKADAETSKVLPQNLKESVVLIKQMNFMGNQELAQTLQKSGQSAETTQAAIAINEKGRVVAMRSTILFLGISSLMFLFATAGIVNRRIEDLNAEDEKSEEK